LPREAAIAARAAGRSPFLIGLVGVTTAEIGDFEHMWLRLGEVGKLFAALKARAIGEIVLIGAMTRPDWRELRLDWGAIRRVDDLARLFRGGDDALLSGIVDILAREGVRVVGVQDVAPALVAPEGRIGQAVASTEDEADVRIGFSLLAALAPFDVGQAAVVADGRAVAVEAAEGTDAMLARVAEMRAGGRLRRQAPSGVFVKTAKRGQDRRLDLPTVGPETIAAARAAGLKGLAVEAGAVLLADRARTIALADEARLFLVGRRS